MIAPPDEMRSLIKDYIQLSLTKQVASRRVIAALRLVNRSLGDVSDASDFNAAQLYTSTAVAAESDRHADWPTNIIAPSDFSPTHR